MAQIVYARVNQILEDEFTLLGTDGARTPITGKVQGDFTIALSKGTATGQSTTGITITEVGLGKYDVTVAATGFPAATGVFTLRISITVSGQAYVIEQIYAITSDGTPTGTTGSAVFTATVNNGRATDGTTALSGATVYIRGAGGNLYTSTTTTAAGLWGPVYFATAGTYTVYGQKSGYAQGSATITVSGSTATLAPASDITMATVSSSSGLTAADLVAYARRSSFDRTGTKADTELLQSVNMAIDMIATAKLWPKYITRGQLSLSGAYSTGSVTTTVGSAAVTLSGGTFPTWAGTGKLLIAGQVYAVLSRDSGTQVTLEATWSEIATAGTNSYVCFQDTYALPDTLFKFGRLVPGQRWPYGGTAVSTEVLIEQQMVAPMALRGPWMWSFLNQSIVVYPYPSTDALCGYWYFRRPTPLVSSTDTADFDPTHIELLRRAIDYQVATLYGEYSGGKPAEAFAAYKEALGRAAPNDRSSTTMPSPMQPPMMDVPIWYRRTT